MTSLIRFVILDIQACLSYLPNWMILVWSAELDDSYLVRYSDAIVLFYKLDSFYPG